MPHSSRESPWRSFGCARAYDCPTCSRTTAVLTKRAAVASAWLRSAFESRTFRCCSGKSAGSVESGVSYECPVFQKSTETSPAAPAIARSAASFSSRRRNR